MAATLTRPAAAGWESYAYGTRVENFAEWSATYAIQSIDRFAGRPLVLEPWQLDFCAEALAVDDSEVPYWKTVIAVLPRKNGKTSLLAAYAEYHADQDDGQPEVLLTASSDKQAGRLYDACSSFTRRSPYLRERFHSRDYIGELVRVDGGAKILRMASDPSRLHGYNPSLVIADELHAWTTPSLRRSWAALTSGGGARANAQVFVITTAGESHERETGILGRLIDANESAGQVERRAALTISRNHDARVLVYNHSAQTKDRRDLAAIRAANPASWVTDDYLARQAASPELSDAEFLQLHGCVWAAGSGTFIDLDAWRALGDGEPIPAGRPLHVMIDGSYRYDTTVVSWASPADDGRVDVDCHVFSARYDAPHHTLCPGGEIDFEAVEDLVIGLGADAREIAFDPRYLLQSAQRIARALPRARVFPIEPQSAHMHDAVSSMRKGVVEGIWRHRNDPVVGAHVQACVVKETPRGPVLDKRLSSRPIDAVVAMCGAGWRATSAPAPRAYVVT